MTTQAELRVYDALAELESEHDGWTVPMESVRARIGAASRSTVHRALVRLQAQGLVERSPFEKGGYRVKRTTGG